MRWNNQKEKARKEEATVGTGGDAPEAQEQHVVEFVFAERPGHGDEEGLAEERRAGVVVARLLVLLPQVHRDHHVLRVLHPVHRQLEPAPSTHPGPCYFTASNEEPIVSRVELHKTLTRRCRPAP